MPYCFLSNIRTLSKFFSLENNDLSPRVSLNTFPFSFNCAIIFTKRNYKRVISKLDQISKKIGLGSLSLLLSILGILFVFSFGQRYCFGDILLNFLGLKAWSNGSHGFHITIFYTLIFFIPSFALGHKFNTDLGAVKISLIACIIIALLFLLLVISL